MYNNLNKAERMSIKKCFEALDFVKNILRKIKSKFEKLIK